jgi:inositol transporter-like SP family MFS transporter
MRMYPRIRPVALILMIFLLISGVVGFLFMPNTAGRSLEEIEAERSGRPIPSKATV